MKRFIFKLEGVLKYRITIETLAKNAYQDALRILNIEKEKLKNLQHDLSNLLQAYNIQAGSVVYSENLAFLAKCTLQLSHLIEQQKKTIKEKESIARKKFQEWNRKRMDLKVIERLKEKKWKEYLIEMDKEDQKFQDEIFLAKKIRESSEAETALSEPPGTLLQIQPMEHL